MENGIFVEVKSPHLQVVLHQVHYLTAGNINLVEKQESNNLGKSIVTSIRIDGDLLQKNVLWGKYFKGF